MTLDEIDNKLVETLRTIGCPNIKTIVDLEPQIKLKDILLDANYLQDKLNIFVWILTKCQPMLANEFSDVDYMSAEAKAKKIADSLHMMSLIDIHEYNLSEKLIATTPKHFKDILLMLDVLVGLIETNPSCDEDTLLSLDFQPNSQQQNMDDEQQRKFCLINDPGFKNDYLTILQYGSTSLIPTDMARLVRTINESSSYMSEAKTIKKCEQMTSLVEQQMLEANNKKSNASKSTENENLNENDYNNQVVNDLKEIEADIEQLKKWLAEANSFFEQNTARFDECDAKYESMLQASQLVSSNLGKNFDDFNNRMQNLNKLSQFFMNYNEYVSKQLRKEKDYETFSSVAMGMSKDKSNVKKTKWPSCLFDLDEAFVDRLDELLTLFGGEQKQNDENNDVDSLLLL